MILRRTLPLALLLSWTAAPALAQGVKIAGEAPKKAEAPKKDDAKPKAKKKEGADKAAPGKKKAAPESKYKSRALTENTENAYRFDSEGNAVGGKKKSSAEKPAKKKSASSGEETPAGKCSTDADACADKPSEADAL